MIDLEKPAERILPEVLFPYWRQPERQVIIFENKPGLSDTEILDIFDKGVSLYNKCVPPKTAMVGYFSHILTCNYDTSDVYNSENFRRSVAELEELRTDIPVELLAEQAALCADFPEVNNPAAYGSHDDLPAEYRQRCSRIWSGYYREYIRLEYVIRNAFIETCNVPMNGEYTASLPILLGANQLPPEYFHPWDVFDNANDRLTFELLQVAAQPKKGSKFIQTYGIPEDKLLAIAGIFGCDAYETHTIYR